MQMFPGDIPRILIVSNNAAISRELSDWLAVPGYAAAWVKSLAAARERLRSESPQIILCENRLPDGMGLELIPEIEKTPAGIRSQLLILSDPADQPLAVKAFIGGAAGFLLKPVQRDELFVHIQRALDRQRVWSHQQDYTHHLERQIAGQKRALQLAQEETIHRLVNATVYRDEETGGHIRRTGLLSEVLARAAGWSAEETRRIRMAAPMHDLGKIAIPDAILRKPGPLSREEFETMKLHTVIGGRLLENSYCPVLQMAHDIALAHHEHWNGRGYPAGLVGRQIPEAARIVSIVDVYDALSHDRVYRRALSNSEVLDLMAQGNGRQFDPRLLSLFFSVYDELARLSREYPDTPRDLQESDDAGVRISRQMLAEAGV
ncbi:HD-GYP domain-containing protein [Planctomicrobium sp. SH664]|uniref:HD-GYP domain-containing protein n=1 Tax=Planctomicrobium sp. SH664 TaxID=3448125 RepID=UPI003F5C48CD